MTLISTSGNLRDAFLELQRHAEVSMCHVDQLMNERRNNYSLCDQQIHTADGLVYYVENGIPKLAITRGEDNPVLQNIEEAFGQLTDQGFYHLSRKEARHSIYAPNSLSIDLSKLEIFPSERNPKSDLYGYIGLPTTNYHEDLENQELRYLVQRLYGQGRDFARNMKMLAEAEIPLTRIIIPTPSYVLRQAKQSPFAKASWLNSFRFSSNFVSDDCVFSNEHHLYGATKEQLLALKGTIRGTRSYSF